LLFILRITITGTQTWNSNFRVMFFIIGVQTITELCVSLNRIDNFLSMEEPPATIRSPTQNVASGDQNVAMAADTSDAVAQQDLERVALLAIPSVPPSVPLGMAQQPSIMSKIQRPDGFVALQGADYDWQRPLGHSFADKEHSKNGCQDDLGKTGQQDVQQKNRGPSPLKSESAAASTSGLGKIGGGGGERGSLELQPGPTLRGLVLELNPGELLGVTGEVGSGKSSLLSALLGELLPLAELPVETKCIASASVASGRPQAILETVAGGGPVVVGSVAYCPQVPWIASGTVRDNIVFGSPWDAELYAEVLEACALEQVRGCCFSICCAH